MDPRKIRTEVAAIQAMLIRNSDRRRGRSNAEVKSEIERRLRAIEHTNRELPAVPEKCASARVWVDILFSDDRHEKYGGPNRVELYIWYDLAELTQIADEWTPPAGL